MSHKEKTGQWQSGDSPGQANEAHEPFSGGRNRPISPTMVRAIEILRRLRGWFEEEKRSKEMTKP